MKLSLVDTLRIIGYAVSALTLLTSETLGSLLSPFGVASNEIAHISAIIGSLVLALTLISSVIAKAVPPGYNTVITQDPAASAASLTTKAATTDTANAATLATNPMTNPTKGSP